MDLPERGKRYFFRVFAIVVTVQVISGAVMAAIIGGGFGAFFAMVFFTWQGIFGLLHSSLWIALAAYGVTRLIDRVKHGSWQTRSRLGDGK